MILMLVKKNSFVIIFSCGILCIWYFWPTSAPQNAYYVPKFDPIEYNDNDQCYKSYAFQNEIALQYKLKSINEINSILHMKDKRKLFFHKTNCIHDGVLQLSAREACGVESAALTNPDANVFLIYAAEVGWTNQTELPFIDALLSYPNIHITTLEADTELESYFSDSPAGEWIKDRKILRAVHVPTHMNEFLRALSLFKFGGTSIDLDVIVIKDLADLQYNFAAPGSPDLMYCGILNLELDSVGHGIANDLLQELVINYNSDYLDVNGHWIVHRVIQKRCNFTENEIIEPVDVNGRCHGFRIYPKEYFYANNWDNWLLAFEGVNSDILKRFSDAIRNSYIVHFSNRLSFEEKVRLHGGSSYDSLASQYCPKVYKLLDDDF